MFFCLILKNKVSDEVVAYTLSELRIQQYLVKLLKSKRTHKNLCNIDKQLDKTT